MATQEPPDLTEPYNKFLRNTSIAMLFLAPAIIAIPPRRFNTTSIALGIAWAISANHLYKGRAGKNLLEGFSFTEELPERAQKFKEQQRLERQKRRLLEEPMPASQSQRQPTALEAKAKEIWMGGETEGWKERRLREEQEKINQGEGYGSMIVDQIWEVWNQGEKKAEGLKEKDEKVLRDRHKEEEFPKIGKDGR